MHLRKADIARLRANPSLRKYAEDGDRFRVQGLGYAGIVTVEPFLGLVFLSSCVGSLSLLIRSFLILALD